MSGSEHPMPEARPAASLTSSLLARRGGARPAMRRQMTPTHSAQPMHEDLGWNDMGEEPAVEPIAAFEPEAPVAIEPVAPPTPINEMLSVIAERINTKPARKSAKAIKAPAALADTGRKAAFTLRIDAERHLRLRLLSAMTNRSAQRLLIDALDELIARNERVKDLARQVEDDQPVQRSVKWGT